MTKKSNHCAALPGIDLTAFADNGDLHLTSSCNVSRRLQSLDNLTTTIGVEFIKVLKTSRIFIERISDTEEKSVNYAIHECIFELAPCDRR
jgi:hypothetical protein